MVLSRYAKDIFYDSRVLLLLTLSIFVVFVIAISNFQAYAEGSQEPTREIMITEVELSSTNGTQWIEVYNPTDHEISLATLHINGSDGHKLQVLAGMSGLLPQNYVLISLQPDDSYPLWSNTNNTLAIYQTDPDLKARGIIDNVTLWDKTPSLTDTFKNSRTWQLNGTSWSFVGETPMRAIPEFPVAESIIASMLAIAIITAIVLNRKHSWQFWH